MPRKKSIVWSYFKKQCNDEVICNKCEKVLKYTGGTSNLIEHLKRYHLHLLINTSKTHKSKDDEAYNPGEVDQNTPVSLSLASTSTTIVTAARASLSFPSIRSQVPKPKRKLKSYKNATRISKKKQAEIDETLVEMMVSDFQPISIIENKGFIKYTKKLNPRYEIPSQKKITNSLIPNMYEAKMAKLKTELAGSSHLAITTDVWESRSTGSFLTVTAHYIKGTEMKSSLLETRQLFNPCEAEEVASTLSVILQEWKIFDKVVTVVTDDAPNMESVVVKHLNKYHHHCVAHTLNLIVKDAINNDNIEKLLDKCYNIVTHFKRNTVASEELVKMQHQGNLPILEVMKEDLARWNICLSMMKWLQEIKAPLLNATLSIPPPLILSPKDWAELEDCTSALELIEELTTELSREKYTMMSMVILLISGLQHFINNLEPKTTIGKNLQNDLQESISVRFSSIEASEISAKSTFLDPRFMKEGFGKEKNADQTQKWMIQEVLEDMTAEQNLLNLDHGLTEVQTLADSGEEETQPNKFWEPFEIKAKRKRLVTTSTEAESQVENYLKLPLIKRKENPLEFWMSKKEIFPELYKLSKKYLCVPATSVPAEHLFSKAYELTIDRRCRLNNTNVNQIVCLNGNIQL